MPFLTLFTFWYFQGYTEPATTVEATTAEPTRFPPRPVPNQAYAKLSSARNSWQTMMDKSNMDIRAYKERRVRNRFNVLTDQMKARHEKLIAAGCSFTKVDEILIGMVFIDYNDTCRTTKKLIHGNFYFIVDKISNWNIYYEIFIYIFRYARVGSRLHYGLWDAKWCKSTQKYTKNLEQIITKIGWIQKKYGPLCEMRLMNKLIKCVCIVHNAMFLYKQRYT